MRIRSTKPEFWRSERIASVDWDARLVLKGLESYVDDNGVGKDDLALIVADVFPRDLSRNPPGTLQKVSEALSTLQSAGLIWRYEAAGTSLLFVSFWESIQRIEKPSKGRMPRPDGTFEYRDSEIREPSGSTTGTLREPSGLEQGNRGTGEQSSSSEIADAIPDRDDVLELCNLLADLMVDNGNKRPTITKAWMTDARLLLDKDERDLEEAKHLIRWCQGDSFWRSNIMSMSKFRQQYDKLRLRREPAKPEPREEFDWQNRGWGR